MSANGKTPPLHASVEAVTPDMARTLLGTMQHNRPIRDGRVDQYAREMAAGQWRLTGEPILVSREGKLMDGQHRLSALLVAKQTVTMLVVRGVDPTAMAAIDTGAARTYGDVMHLRGDEHAENPHAARGIPAVCRLWWLYENTQGMTSRMSPTHQEIDLIRVQHPTIAGSVARLANSPFRRFWPVSVAAFCHSYISEKIDAEMAELFVTDVEKGANLDEDSPLYLLRRRLLDDSQARLSPTMVLALTIKAYNAWMENSPLKILVYRPSSNEAFPRFGSIGASQVRGRPRRSTKAGAS